MYQPSSPGLLSIPQGGFPTRTAGLAEMATRPFPLPGGGGGAYLQGWPWATYTYHCSKSVSWEKEGSKQTEILMLLLP